MCRFQYSGRWTSQDEQTLQCHASSGPGRFLYDNSTSQTIGYTKTINWTNKDDLTSFNCTINGINVPTQHLLAESSNVNLYVSQA